MKERRGKKEEGEERTMDKMDKEMRKKGRGRKRERRRGRMEEEEGEEGQGKGKNFMIPYN